MPFLITWSCGWVFSRHEERETLERRELYGDRDTTSKCGYAKLAWPLSPILWLFLGQASYTLRSPFPLSRCLHYVRLTRAATNCRKMSRDYVTSSRVIAPVLLLRFDVCFGILPTV